MLILFSQRVLFQPLFLPFHFFPFYSHLGFDRSSESSQHGAWWTWIYLRVKLMIPDAKPVLWFWSLCLFLSSFLQSFLLFQFLLTPSFTLSFLFFSLVILVYLSRYLPVIRVLVSLEYPVHSISFSPRYCTNVDFYLLLN